jgi:hypothetical protein
MAPKARSNLVHYYASEIEKHWSKALESIFAVSVLLIEARKKLLDPSDWESLKDELPFSDSVLKKLLAIGRDARLRKANLYKLLPPNYSIIYEVTQLEDEELQTAVMEGEISPRMRRAPFIAWRNDHRGGENDYDPFKKIPSAVSASIFAALTIYPDPGQLPVNKALKLKDELTSIWKRYGLYGVDVQYGQQERMVMQKARSELAEKFRAEFHKAVANLNRQLDQDKLDLIESALWQHRALESGEPLPYLPDHPNSIENKRHPYSIHRGWTYKSLLKETQGRRIITTWTPIKDSEGLGQAKSLQLAIHYLEGTRGRGKSKAELESIARARSKDSKFAEECLKQLVGL